MNCKPGSGGGVAFMLAQLGAHAAFRFAERIAMLGIAPPHAGILRLIAATPACNQQVLAQRLGVVPSRMVMLIDELAGKGFVERKRSQRDRRHSEIALTKAGGQLLEKLGKIAAEHEADLCASLTPAERETLANLCRKIVQQQGLTPGVHPGYRRM
ncbi:MAG TPA: MarR family transcriptional regulator [Verrucomicrobiae bacterium]|nr:MarR family transcriptional regulator [Verrucomicrobiae bacterium]